MQLSVPDVESDHPGGAVLEQAVGEPAGRRADVEAVLARRVESEQLEGMRELLTAARDEPRRPFDLQDDRLVELRPRLVVAGHEPGDHEGLRLAAGLRKATLHEEDIEPLLHRRRVEAGACYTCGMELRGEPVVLRLLEGANATRFVEIGREPGLSRSC